MVRGARPPVNFRLPRRGQTGRRSASADFLIFSEMDSCGKVAIPVISPAAMSPRLLFTIVFIEGYCSLGGEIIALRRLIPHVGSSIVVTAPTIGLFLLALALGYHSGSRVAANYRGVVARNFLISAALMGAGLAGGSVDAIFVANPAGMAYLIFIGTILCPLAWLLGQTVPILTNLMRAQRSGEAAGRALFWSTLGSFLGSVTLSLVVMQLFGVWAAVLLGALMLVAGAALVQRPQALTAGLLLTVAALSVATNLGDRRRADTAYADYAVEPVERETPASRRATRATSAACAACCSTSWASAGAACWCWAPAASRCRTASRSIITCMSTSTPR
jgi:hypothetical protein